MSRSLIIRKSNAKDGVLQAAAKLVIDLEKERPLNKDLKTLTKKVKRLKKISAG